MSSESQSKIKTARKPANGDSYPCQECGSSIYPRQEYFCYQTGQRSSHAYCLECARTDRDLYDAQGRSLDRPYHTLYVKRYGTVRKSNRTGDYETV